MRTKTDFLGNEYKAGDYVIYAITSSQSINMIKAQVVEILDNGKVKLQPLAASRWKTHTPKTYDVDSRTGKRINRWHPKHIKEESYYLTPTGTRLSQKEYRDMSWRDREWVKAEYVPTVFHDYVETRSEPVKPVTISVTENIVKFADGELVTEG